MSAALYLPVTRLCLLQFCKFSSGKSLLLVIHLTIFIKDFDWFSKVTTECRPSVDLRRPPVGSPAVVRNLVGPLGLR